MKKFLLLFAVLGVVTAKVSFADNKNASWPMMNNPTCKPAMEHMRASHEQIEQLIQQNKPTDIGNLIIADHKYMEDFIKKNPECKPHMMKKQM